MSEENSQQILLEFEQNEQETIDYVLVNKINETEYEIERNHFEHNLQNTGLKLSVLEETDKCRFVKIHAPQNILLQYCEIMKLKMPLKSVQQDENKLTEQFSRHYLYLFDTESKDFIAPSTKYLIINYILENEIYNKYSISEEDEEEELKFGITKLLLKGAYQAAYSLHDEEQRSNLRENWTTLRKCFHRQPIDDIKNYFGIKIALYFTWLEFYSTMLIPASIFGFLYIIIGLATLSSDKNVSEICKRNHSFLMCPQCDVDCELWEVKDYCTSAKITHLVDNSWSVIFAIFMSLGCVIYLNLWKRYSAEIVRSWGVSEDHLLDYELPTAHDFNKNISEQRFSKLPKFIFSFAVVLFWICIVLAVLIGLTFYRICLSASEFLYADTKAIIVPVTGSVFDLISILILNEIYGHIAVWLTDKELHRTQKQYEASLMWKLYVFWFINYYSSFFYLAFLRGRFVGLPSGYNRVFGYRQEECGPGGCIADLFIQIAVVLIGDMTYNNIIEYLVPYLKKNFRTLRVNSDIKNDENANLLNCTQWVKDYKLLRWESKNISLEHLEMVLQYGMVTLFIAAFPLAPLCALINNIFEIRMDAKNLLTNFRRPVAQNVRNIGIWITIMNLVSELAVITNGCIIAFTTNFIPHLVYKLHRNDSNKEESFLDFSLSRFKLSDFENHTLFNFNNVTECRYPDYRNPPEFENKYKLSEIYWHILAARLIFVLVFENLVAVLKLFINYLIPEMPTKLKKKIISEAKKTQRFIINEENKIRRRSLRLV